MTWDYDSITSATPADALADKIEAAMDDSGFYTHVEDHTISTTLYRVWHNSDAGFHVILYHASAGTGNLTFQLCESYNSSAHTMEYVAAPSSTAYGFLRTDYGFTTGYGNGATGFALNINANLTRLALTTNTTGFTYAVSASADRVVAATLVGSSVYGPIYAGKFETFLDGTGGTNPVTDPGAYTLASFATFTDGGVTRFINPATAGTNASTSFQFHRYDAHTGTWGTPSSLSLPYDGIVISRLRMSPYIIGNTTIGPRGLLKGIVTMVSDGSYAFGDELNVNGAAKYKVIRSNCAVEML